MSLPIPNLDDLRFQRDLVDVARRKIAQYCPEWTDYNLSDPGITLIELFAWMTEQIVWRLNRVPEKVRIEMLNMMGFTIQPATTARVPLTFRLTTRLPFSEDDESVAWVPSGTEVATRATEESPEVVFSTDNGLMIVPPVIVQLRKESVYNKNFLPRLGLERFSVFNETRPQEGDRFYIGYDDQADLAGHIINVVFECEETQATGIRRSDPPWIWECSLGGDTWTEIFPSTRSGEEDTTGGLNNEDGSITFHLPLEFKPDVVHGKEAFWMRCTLRQRRREQGMYSQSPLVTSMKAFSIGASTMASQSTVVDGEILGESTGEPSQTFDLNYSPALALADDEQLTVEEMQFGDVVPIPWQQVETFANSSPFDRHYVLDIINGIVMFGPRIIQPDGTAQQYGRIPEPNREIAISKYRYGGGQVGNVPEGRITQLRSTIPYVLEVVNLERASGGRDAESLDEAMFRAQREIRMQDRAVTAKDFEDLTLSASRMVARAKALVPHMKGVDMPAGLVDILVVPAVFDAVAEQDYKRLAVTPKIVQDTTRHLDKYRLLTSRIRVQSPKYVGIRVETEIISGGYSNPEVVQNRVLSVLRQYFSPLDITTEQTSALFPEDWDGWQFGQAIFRSAVFALLQQVPGVQNVIDVKIYSRSIDISKDFDTRELQLAMDDDDWILLDAAKLAIDPNVLPISLAHQVKFAEL